jgi:hypothetical protein
VDEGRTWEHVTRATPDFPVVSLALDPRQPGRLLAVARGRGVFVRVLGASGGGKSAPPRREADRGATSKPVHEKMRIPRGYTAFAHAGKLWASTPGGLYETADGGRSWREIHLWPEHETGSADYLHAYWMGRYYGFIPAPTPGG